MTNEEKQIIIDKARDLIIHLEHCDDDDFRQGILNAVFHCEHIDDVDDYEDELEYDKDDLDGR